MTSQRCFELLLFEPVTKILVITRNINLCQLQIRLECENISDFKPVHVKVLHKSMYSSHHSS